MTPNLLGASLALATAVFWAISPFCFASASRRIGSRPVAVLRAILATALLLLLVFLRILLGRSPVHAPGSTATILIVISGILGLGIGDLMGYEAYMLAGVQRTILIGMLAPVTAVICAWFAFGESMGGRELLGIGLVMAGTALVLDGRYDSLRTLARPSPTGMALAFGSAICQGLGAVTLRWAYHYGPRIDPVVATTLRVAGAAVFLTAMSPILSCNLMDAIRKAGPHEWSRIAAGTLVGPFVGMLCYVTALSVASAGLCSALSSASPIFVLAIAAARYRTAPTPLALLASIVAVGGVALLMMG